MLGQVGPGPEVSETPVDITQSTFGSPPSFVMTPSPAPVMTTADVNGDPDVGGSIDGGPADAMCAWWVAQNSPHHGAMVELQAANQRAVQRWGMPLYVPSLMGMASSFGLMLLGGVYGGYHGWRRSGGKWLPTLGYGALTAYVPVVGVLVSVFQGPFTRRR